jgi:hypothetical protein
MSRGVRRRVGQARAGRREPVGLMRLMGPMDQLISPIGRISLIIRPASLFVEALRAPTPQDTPPGSWILAPGSSKLTGRWQKLTPS